MSRIKYRNQTYVVINYDLVMVNTRTQEDFANNLAFEAAVQNPFTPCHARSFIILCLWLGGLIYTLWFDVYSGSMMIYELVVREDFANNPAFEAAVQQSVNALLPRIREEMREEVRQEMANGAGTSGGGGNPPETIHTWLERFNKQKPHSFSTVTSPDDAEHWIAHMEKIFEVLGCGDIFKARLATYKFEGDALNWWKAYKYAKGGDNPNEETSTEFMKRFVRLAGFLGDKAVNMHFDDVAVVANAVRNIEIVEERVKQGVKRNYDGDRVHGSNQRGSDYKRNDRWVVDTRGSDRHVNDRRGYDYRGYDRQNDRRGYDARGSDRHVYRSGRDYRSSGSSVQDRRVAVDTCKTCGKSHPGRQCHRISGVCFNCSQTGHMARDCPKPLGYNQSVGRDRTPAATANASEAQTTEAQTTEISQTAEAQTTEPQTTAIQTAGEQTATIQTAEGQTVGHKPLDTNRNRMRQDVTVLAFFLLY
ncbi:zinc finger, CCHC-type, Retrotransposon gag domain protein [Artemisia annua]|uniref:Zinc finger, CCHC-type, Retrotransposon gag domain protein n=1 Tax=Artemisia annua TaxID=35608 RepID=A0A2U1P553_ARTAN|nr:zinc finger, CCHC-type, Retrotransposon gag domain protein [Artemisia annua]